MPTLKVYSWLTLIIDINCLHLRKHWNQEPKTYQKLSISVWVHPGADPDLRIQVQVVWEVKENTVGEEGRKIGQPVKGTLAS